LPPKTAAKKPAAAVASAPFRLSSIDALRGFVMFWIIGGDQIFPLLSKASPGPLLDALAVQFDHVPWNGLVFYDLIFPTFMFLAGASMPFAFGKHLANGGSKSSLRRKVVKRAAIIIALGLVYNGLFAFSGLAAMRFPGVLQRIGLSYLFGAFIFLGTGPKGRAAWVAAILLAYWAILTLIPVPGIGAGILTPEGNLAGYVDRLLLHGTSMCCYEFGDNEGFLSSLPAVTTVVMGSFAGLWLLSPRPAAKKALGLFSAGLALFALGWLWNPLFPVNKNLWTSSFALAAAGCSSMMLALFYWLIDVKGWKAWAFLLIVIGMNSITIYLAQEIVNFDGIAKYFVGGASAYAGAYGALVMALGTLTAKIGFLYFLWRQKVFLRV
jgi:predicted acyltransferase